MPIRPWSLVAWIGCLAITGTASHAAVLPAVTPVGQLSLPYSHRFTATDRLVSTPTFTLASGLRDGLEASLRLALDSDIRRSVPEWEPRLTYQMGPRDTSWRLSFASAFNTAAVSGDLALFGAYEVGSVTFRGSSGAFTNGYGVGGPTGALGMGLDWHINGWLTATADYGGVVLSQNLEAIANQLPPMGLTQAWRFGLLIGPTGRQQLEFYVTNSHTHTLQGLHRGSDQVQLGFEYQLPLLGMPVPEPTPEVSLPSLKGVPDPYTVSMRSATSGTAASVLPQDAYPLGEEVLPIRVTPAVVPTAEPRKTPRAAPRVTPVVAPRVAPPVRRKVAEVLEVRMGAGGYAPAEILIKRGTLVRWVNHDRISHTTTAHGLWDSLWKKPGKTFERRFDEMGVFPYQCKRHPHERGIVRVI